MTSDSKESLAPAQDDPEDLVREADALLSSIDSPYTFQHWGEQNQNGDHAESILFDSNGETVVYGMPDKVGEFTVSAPDLIQRLRDSVAHWRAEAEAEYYRHIGAKEEAMYLGQENEDLRSRTTTPDLSTSRELRKLIDDMQALGDKYGMGMPITALARVMTWARDKADRIDRQEAEQQRAREYVTTALGQDLDAAQMTTAVRVATAAIRGEEKRGRTGLTESDKIQAIVEILGDASEGTADPDRVREIANRALAEACNNEEMK